jgi:carbamoyltransferase
MLFEYRVRADWVSRIPATIHLDGSARLQTVSDRSNPVMASILRAYYERTRIPVLCNTSANRPGCGFFPDVTSAAEWGEIETCGPTVFCTHAARG